MPDAASPVPAPQPKTVRRWTFSLRTLLLVGVVIALSVSHFMTTWRLKQATEEIQQLRSEAGYLEVTDKQRIYALQVPTVENMLWKWKVHLPPDRRRTLRVATHNIPVSGFPNAGSISWAPSDEPITITV